MNLWIKMIYNLKKNRRKHDDDDDDDGGNPKPETISAM